MMNIIKYSFKQIFLGPSHKFLKYTVLNFNKLIADLKQIKTGLGDSSFPSPDYILKTDENKKTDEKNGKKL